MESSRLTQDVIQQANVTICLNNIEQVDDLDFCTIICNMAKYMLEVQGYYMFKHKNSQILIALKS